MTKDDGAVELFGGDFEPLQLGTQMWQVDVSGKGLLELGTSVFRGNIVEPSPEGLEETRRAIAGDALDTMPLSQFAGNQRIHLWIGEVGGDDRCALDVAMHEAVVESAVQGRREAVFLQGDKGLLGSERGASDAISA